MSNPNLLSPQANNGYYPTPSPAACGKRKHLELSAANMLASVNTANTKWDKGERKNTANGVELSKVMDVEGGGNSVEDYFQQQGGGKKNLPVTSTGSLFFETPTGSPRVDGEAFTLVKDPSLSTEPSLPKDSKKKAKKMSVLTGSESSAAPAPPAASTTASTTASASSARTQSAAGGHASEVIYPIGCLTQNKRSLRLLIVNPDQFRGDVASARENGEQSPSTPWDSQMKSLENYAMDGFEFDDIADIDFTDLGEDAVITQTTSTTTSSAAQTAKDNDNDKESRRDETAVPTPPPPPSVRPDAPSPINATTASASVATSLTPVPTKSSGPAPRSAPRPFLGDTLQVNKYNSDVANSASRNTHHPLDGISKRSMLHQLVVAGQHDKVTSCVADLKARSAKVAKEEVSNASNTARAP